MEPAPETPVQSEENSIYGDVKAKEPEKKIKQPKKIPAMKLSRNKAKGYACTWHPWRSAYAMCAFCNRPFCIEDIADFNKQYYCLEDVEGISSKYANQIANTSQNIAVLAGILLVVSFFLFYYFSYNNVVYIAKLLYATGLSTFVGYITFNYILVFIEIVLTIIGLVGAMLIFAQSKKGIYLGIISSVGNILILSYQALTVGNLYFWVIDATMFLAFLCLIYSKMTSTLSNQKLKSESSIAKSELSKYPNAGKF